MKKLGLIIKNTNDGEQEGFSINKEENWTKYASDARSAIKELESFDGSGKVVYLVRFLGSLGYLFCVIKARSQSSGRKHDNTAAWIYVPSRVTMSAEEMENILKTVEKNISSEYNIDEKTLTKVFEKEYPEKNLLFTASESIKSKDESLYALRYYNDTYQLNELIGENLFQKEYGKYRGLFLVDKRLDIKLSKGKTLDFEPKQVILISSAKKQDGFTPYLRDSQEFDRDIEDIKGSVITVVWEKDHYAPIKRTITVENKDDISKLKIEKEEIKRRILRSEVTVKTDKGKTIDDATIHIKGQQLDEYVDIPEDDLGKTVNVNVSAEGYNEAEEPYNKNGVIVTLSRRKYPKVLKIDVENASNGKLSFDSDSEDYNSSPIKGYEVVGHDEDAKLQYNGNEGKANDLMAKFFALGFASCFALLLLLCGGWYVFEKISTPKERAEKIANNETSEKKGNTNSAAPTKEDSPSNKEKMKSYLSQPMEKDSCIKLDYEKLWNALNTFDVNEVEKYEKDFSELKEVVKKLKKYKEAIVLERLNKYTEESGKKEISLSEYKVFLNKKISEAQNQNKPSDESMDSTESDTESSPQEGSTNGEGRGKNTNNQD